MKVRILHWLGIVVVRVLDLWSTVWNFNFRPCTAGG